MGVANTVAWLWCGALVFTAAAGEKLSLAGTGANLSVFLALKRLPHPAFVALGSCYGGLVSGATEVGTTLLAGLLWRGLRQARRSMLAPPSAHPAEE